MIKGSFVILLLTYRKPHQLSVGFVVFLFDFQLSDFIDFYRLNDFYDFPTINQLSTLATTIDFPVRMCVRTSAGVRLYPIKGGGLHWRRRLTVHPLQAFRGSVMPLQAPKG